MGDYADMAWDPCDPGSWVDLPRPRRTPQPKTCNRCGKTGLWWREVESGWRLHEFDDDGTLLGDLTPHVCQAPLARKEP